MNILRRELLSGGAAVATMTAASAVLAQNNPPATAEAQVNGAGNGRHAAEQ